VTTETGSTPAAWDRDSLPEGEEKVEAVRQMFDAIAPRYDLVNRLMTFRLDVRWRRLAVRSLELSPGAVVADLASGTGDLCVELARQHLRPLSIDLSFGMLHADRSGAPRAQADILRLPFDHDVAENLFVAISTDTGSFQYPKTSARTFEIAAGLVHDGELDVGKISQHLYENYPRRRLELLRELLRTMRFSECGRIATFGLSLKNAAELGVIPEDNEGLIDHLRAVQGVIVAVFFEELSDGKVRVSMRSKDERVDVCAICQKFGGGGHTLAAGARVPGTLAEIEEKVLEETGETIKRACIS